MNLIIFGPPGSGKGTQSRILSKTLDIALIDVGYLLRSKMKNMASISNTMNSGNLLSDEIVNNFVMEELVNIKSDFILDGFPRTIGQASFLSELLKKYDKRIDHVIRLEVERSLLIQRLTNRLCCKSCGAIYNASTQGKCSKCSGELVIRADDCIEVIQNRLKKYHEQETSLINSYHDKLVSINGEGSVNQVTKKILLKIAFET